MRFRTWPVAALGLGGLLLLVVVSALASVRRADEIYNQLNQLNAHHRNVDVKLRRLRSDVHLSGIFMRDYLLDAEHERSGEYRQRLAQYRHNNMATLDELRALADPDDQPQISSLQTRLEDYWEAFVPLFDWTAAEKISQSAEFIRREVLPRREAVMAIALQIEELNNANLAAQRAEVRRGHESFRNALYQMLWQSLFLGVIVALTVVIRLRVLERRSEQERALAEDAERQMRQLSQQLVATQEAERKNLSRELHDHVGQMLTALRMELGRIDRLRATVDDRLVERVAECRQLVDNMVRTVRDLALGLRPSMLDDFGLQPALEWHVRDFSRRFGLRVELAIEGDLDGLPEPQRLCVYRAVQEALTNCVRHARAQRVTISIDADADRLDISVSDDGIGLEPGSRREGLGLLGIQERVKELHGTLTINSAAGRGTTLSIRLPRAARLAENALARAAG